MATATFRSLLTVLLAGVLVGGCGSLMNYPANNRIGTGPYATYVTGRPPLVTDRFLLDTPGQEVIGELQFIRARNEDTFVDIARAYNLGYDELVEANPGIDPWMPGEGTRILLPTQFILPDAPREGIVINVANKRLFWYVPADEDGQRAVMTFPIGIGEQGTATPLGTTKITQKAKDPTWYPPASIRREYAAEGNPIPAIVPPGPDNPLGSHALLLGMPSYLIHGTNRPAGVGMRVSHGCVRMFPENIELLYAEVPVGAQVTIVDQPWLIGWHREQLLLEAHRPLADDVRDWPAQLPDMLQTGQENAPYGVVSSPDAALVAEVTDQALGIPLPIVLQSPSRERYLADVLEVNNVVELPVELRQAARDGVD